ncbi:MAG: carbohydrate ABC transporter permease [bacterium]|nr:carbohydrate ABC transporter permease [bacterium]
MKKYVTMISVGLVAAVVNLPLINALWVSFKADAAINSSPLSAPIPPTFEHYQNATYAAGYNFPDFFQNSTMIALGTALLVLGIAIPAVYANARLGFGGRPLANLVTSLRLLPAIFFAIPFFLMFARMGLTDTIRGMIIVNTFLNLPLAVVLLTAGFNDVPTQLEEAAAVDGASPYRTLWSVLVPILAPAIVATAILVFMFSWNDYLFAVILTTVDAVPVTVGASRFVTSFGIRWGDISAATVLSAAVPLMFAVFAQRYLVTGLSMGALKG